LVKYENCYVLSESHSTLNRWKNYFSQLFNVPGVKNIRQTEIHTAEPLVHEPSSFEAQITIGKLKRQIVKYLSSSGRTNPSRR
jgi:hypothetical protein